MPAFIPALLGGLKAAAGKQVANKVLGGGKKGGAKALPGKGGGGGYVGGPPSQGGSGTSPIVPRRGGALVAPRNPKKVKVKSTGTVSFTSIGNQLNSIGDITESLETLETSIIKRKQDQAAKNRRDRAKADNERKENRLANMAGSGVKFLGRKAGEAGKKFGILDFLTNIALGSLALGTLRMIPRAQKAMEELAPKLRDFFVGLRGITLAARLIGPGIKGALKLARKGIGKAFKPVKNLFGRVGTSLKNVFKALGKNIKNIIQRGLRAAGGAIRGGANLALRGGQKALQMLPGGKALLQQGGRLSNTAAKLSFDARLRAAELRRAAAPVTSRLSNTAAKLSFDARLATRQVAKAVGPVGDKLKGALKIGKNALKGLKSSLKRVPIIGPILVGVISLLSGEPADRALFKVGGTALGGFLGTFIPIPPPLGTILGELIGEYVGDLMWTLIKGGGVDAVGKKMQQDIQNVLLKGQQVLGWFGDGWGRTMEGLPKVKMPGWAPFGLGGLEIPNIKEILADPGKTFGTLQKAFFSRDPMGEEKPEEVKPKTQTQDEHDEELERLEFPEHFTDTGTTTVEPTTPLVGEATLEGHRPGSDGLADHVSLAPASTQSKVPFSTAGGNKNRRIFLHWSAGSYNTAYGAYHTIFLGDGTAVRNTPYGTDKNSHTAGANTGSIGLSIAAMAGGTENASTWPTPPKRVQLEAMTSEAAKIALDWGMSPSDIDSMVMTHGEWERYATKNGILPGRPQRWDLDKLKPSDPRIDTSKVKSSGGDQLRAMIKAKMRQDMSDTSIQPVSTSPSSPITSGPPQRSDYTGRSGAARYKRDLEAYNAAQASASQAQISAQVAPSSTSTPLQQQASYEQTGSQSTVAAVPVPIRTSGARSPGRSGMTMIGSGDLLNSYYRAQFMGSMYKHG